MEVKIERTTRNFGRKIYKLDSGWSTEHDAYIQVRALRTLGYFARKTDGYRRVKDKNVRTFYVWKRRK